MPNHFAQKSGLYHLDILSSPAPIPNRINEDAWLTLESREPPGYMIAAVIDGAGERLALPSLKAELEKNHNGLTSAAFAAGQVRRSLVSQFNAEPERSLRTALLRANETLREAVTEAIGGFSPEHVLAAAEMPADSEPRRMRLALPACVVTLVRLNYSQQLLEYAHGGDTSLLEIRRNGEVICHTTDQMGPYDQAVLSLAARLRDNLNLPHIVDAVRLPEVQMLNLENGLRHNYVDEQGRTQPGEGCGVIDGLPELVDYIETGSISIDPVETEGFCLMSDGLELMAPLAETSDQTEARLRQTGALLRSQGVRGLFRAVQQMAKSDPYFDQYPRMKAQDDATGIYLEILEKE